MALTLAEAERRSMSPLIKGVVEILINEGEILPFIPFQNFEGISYTYLRESTLPTVAFRQPGDVWTESSPVTTSHTAKLKILGGDVDTDFFLLKTLSNVNDQKAIDVMQKVKAMARTINDKFIYGDEDNDAKEWDGLHDFLQSNTGQRVELGASSAEVAPTITKLREMLRLIKGGKPDVILMSRVCRDGLARYFENGLVNAVLTRTEFGKGMDYFDGIPLYGTDYITDTETVVTTSFGAKTGGAGSSIFAMRFGEDGVFGIQNGGMQLLPIGSSGGLETKDATRVRVRWYLNPCVIKSTLAVAGITGVDPDGTWAD